MVRTTVWEEQARLIEDTAESWKAEHGDTGHRAEAAVLAGARALLGLDQLQRDDFQNGREQLRRLRDGDNVVH